MGETFEEFEGETAEEEGERSPDPMDFWPETYYRPIGMQVHKVNTPQGRLTLLKCFTPGHIHTIKLEPEQVSELVQRLSSGLVTATPADLAKLL